MRIGMGYDVHRLTEDRELILGGVEIPFEKGLLGHSDAGGCTVTCNHGCPARRIGAGRYRKAFPGYGSGI